MLLDLFDLALLTDDLLELISIIVNWASGSFLVSHTFILFVILFAGICIAAWKSTFVPDLPLPPTPPFVIQISSNFTPSSLSNNNNNDSITNHNFGRHSIADIRVIQSPHVEPILRRFPPGHSWFHFHIHRRIPVQRSHRNSSTNNSQISSSEISPGVPIISDPSNFSSGLENSSESSTTSSSTNVGSSSTPSHHQSSVTTVLSNSNRIFGLLRRSSDNGFHAYIRSVVPSRSAGPGPLRLRGSILPGNNSVIHNRVSVYNRIHNNRSRALNSSTSGNQNSSSINSVLDNPLQHLHSLEAESTTNDQDRLPNSSDNRSNVDNYSTNPFTLVSSSEVVQNTLSESNVHGSSNGLTNTSPTLLRNSEQQSGRASCQEEDGNIVRANSSVVVPSEVSLDKCFVPSTSSDKMDSSSRSHTSDSNDLTMKTDEPGERRVIHFTIKFLNDTQMDVSSPSDEKVLDFKRYNNY